MASDLPATRIPECRTNTPEPLMVATALHVLHDVETKLAVWREALAARRSVIAAEFGRHLLSFDVPVDTDFGEYAEWKADSVIEAWCKHRRVWSDEIAHALHPDTIVVAQTVGLAGRLGEIIGLHLDNAIRDLDSDLREMVEDAKARRRA